MGENGIEQWAKSNNRWFTEEEIAGLDFIGSGSEARVFEDGDTAGVIKVVNYRIYNHSVQEFLHNRVTVYNWLFPETSYELIGFARCNEAFCVILRQPFVIGRSAEYSEIDEEMERRGFRNTAGFYHNDYVIVEDLHRGNVLKSQQGNLFFIDTIPTPIVEPIQLNDYHRQGSHRAAGELKEMACQPLTLQEKRAQTEIISLNISL